MPVEVIMPKVDMDMATGRISAWHVAEGDLVAKNDPLFEFETDKAAMEVESPAAGRLFHVSAGAGEEVAIGVPIAWIYADGEEVGDPPAASDAPSHPVSGGMVQAPDTASDTGGSLSRVERQIDKPRATPMARRLASEAGLDLAEITGSGHRGRIVGDDVSAALEPVPQPATTTNVPNDLRQPEVGPLAVHRSGSGDGVPFFHIHGFANDSGSWTPLMRTLPNDCAHVRLDLPGHGRSPRRSITGFKDLARYIVEAFDAAGIDRINLVGHSLGGALAIALADVRPRRIASLALIAPAGLGPEIDGAVVEGITRASRSASLTPWLKQLVFDEDLITASFVQGAMTARNDAPMRAFQADLADVLFPDGVQAFDLRAALSRLDAPTKIIWGRQDRVTPWKHALQAQGTVALHLLDGVGHLPHVEKPDVVATLLKELASTAKD